MAQETTSPAKDQMPTREEDHKREKIGHARSVNRLLFSIADAANTTLDLDDLYLRIHTLLGEVIDVTNIFIALVNLSQRTIHFPYFIDTTDDNYTDIHDFDTSRSLTGMVALAKSPLLLKEKELQKRSSIHGILGTTPLIWMGVPLIVRDEVIGVVAVQSYTDAKAYNEDDLSLLAAISHQIAIAIDRKHSLEELKNSEQRYRQLFEHLNDALFLIDSQQKILDCNSRASEMTGYPVSELLHQSFTDLIPKKDRNKITARLCKLNGEGRLLFETGLHKSDGIRLDIEISTRLVEMSDQDVVQMIIRDITEKKLAQREKVRLEEKLYRSRKMEAIGLLAGGVAHDLNNILSGIVSYPELILMKLEAGHELVPKVQAIHDAGKRAAHVVDDLLTIARSVATIKKPCDLHCLVLEYLHSPECMVLKERFPEIRIATKFKAKKSIVYCSEIHVKKSLMNLIHNSMEAIDQQGTILIETFDTPCSSGNDGKAMVTLQVADDGPGIAKKDLEHIFEPFYTKKTMGKSGTGLGLAVVWNTMKDHNGEARVVSTADGPRFSLVFPVTGRKVKPTVNEQQIAELKGKGEKILIVDDEPQIRDIAKQILGSLGYICWTVESGEQAIAFLRHHKVDVVLLDMLMGSGINGRKTYEELIKIRPGQKAIIASGFSQGSEVNLALLQGVYGFVKKPYTAMQLGKVLREVLCG